MGKFTDKIKGKLMRGEGKLTDDKLREAQGYVTEKKADVKNGIDKVKNRVNAGISKAKRKAGAAKRMP